MNINKFLLKLVNKKKYQKYKNEKKFRDKVMSFKKYTEPKIVEISKRINEKKEITFLHSGHLGDIINSLPLIKEISKSKKCKLFIEANKSLPSHAHDILHPFGNFFLTEEPIKKLFPLLNKQTYIDKVDFYNDQEIDINLNLFRDLPINFNLDSIRWYFHLAGIHGKLDEPYLINIDQHSIKNKIIIIRSRRRKNYFINYNFLKNYNDVLFLGLIEEFEELKKEIPNLMFHDCKNFLEMAQIINSSKLFIGNLSFGYTLAEALKKPRLLESGPDFPLVYPNGKNAYDFYFQNHFENNFKKIYLKK